MGGGGGGDGGMQMMMMMMMQQAMQAQMAQQKKEAERQQFMASQRAENQNYTRYNDMLSSQNSKVGGMWDQYNSNIDKILKINPQYNAHQKYTFNPYSVNKQYTRSRTQDEADANTDLLNQWYSQADKQSLDDFNMAKSQYEASKGWLADAQATADAANRVMPGAAPGTWGAGGEQVGGGAGADSLNQQPGAATGTDVGGANAANSGIYNIAGGSGSPSGTAAAQTMGTGFIDDPSTGSLAGVMSSAVGDPTKKSSGSSANIF